MLFKSKLAEAVVKHFESELAIAEAELANYFENPAAIGEHGCLVKEVVSRIKLIEENASCLERAKSLTP